MPRQATPTSRDVAALAGVSTATVSYVVNGRDSRVGKQTRERVLAAAHELGYAPNTLARGLKRQRTERVCLVVSAIGVPTHDKLTRDLSAVADATGHSVITMVVDSEQRAHQAFDLLQQRVADGAVVAASSQYVDDIRIGALARSGLPMVVMSNAVLPQGYDVVRIPERAACRAAFDQLFTAGRRRVAFVGHQVDLACPTRGRIGAYHDALAAHDIPVDERLVVLGADDRVSGYRAVQQLLSLPEPPDAVFAASDRAAISGLRAIHDAGMTVPDDVAVVGVGNLEEGLVTTPTLTTVGMPRLDYSGVVRLLFERMQATHAPDDRELVLPWRFIPRGSI